VRLPDLLKQLRQAQQPEDIFGVLAGEHELKQRYHQLAAVAHPDRNPSQVVEASEAFRLLQAAYAAARRKCVEGIYGKLPRLVIGQPPHEYVAYGAPLRGDLCDLYAAEGDGGPIVIKIARALWSNDLLEAEARALGRLADALKDQPARAHVPSLVAHIALRDASGAQRRANLLRPVTGSVSLAQVLAAYPDGIDAADAAWMFNRLLVALAVAHDQGIVHGAVVPSNVLVCPADHNGVLIDWCYSVAPGEAIRALSPPYAADYPPEVHARQPASFATDIYMAARTLLRLLGGDPATGMLPRQVPAPIAALLRACLIPAPTRRHADAWQLHDNVQSILRELYGPPRFRPFAMPQPA
jgi:hypothetical protein